jgi:transmembrane sensor
MLSYSLAAGCALLLAVRWFGPALSPPVKGVAFENGQAGRQTLVLPDGSRVEIATDSRLMIDEYSESKVQLSLSQGRARFEVAHQEKRPFLVQAGDYEVRVVGTRFSVSLGPDASHVLTVEVQQGKVAVRSRRSPQDVSVLSAGQSWTSGPSVDATSAASSSEASKSDSATPLPPSVNRPASEDTPVGVEPPAVGDPVAKPGPRELLEKAEQLRIRGKLRESAEVLNRLRSNYRSDPRASLAAFELGRLRMDIFGDLNGSVEALRDAIALNPSATFREDAESRLVQIYYRQGNHERCQVAKLAYLKRYPSGAASKVVSRLCEP